MALSSKIQLPSDSLHLALPLLVVEAARSLKVACAVLLLSMDGIDQSRSRATVTVIRFLSGRQQGRSFHKPCPNE